MPGKEARAAVSLSVGAAVAAPTRPFDTDVASLYVPSAPQVRATGQRRIRSGERGIVNDQEGVPATQGKYSLPL
jgi:hypothetical protein